MVVHVRCSAASFANKVWSTREVAINLGARSPIRRHQHSQQRRFDLNRLLVAELHGAFMCFLSLNQPPKRPHLNRTFCCRKQAPKRISHAMWGGDGRWGSTGLLREADRHPSRCQSVGQRNHVPSMQVTREADTGHPPGYDTIMILRSSSIHMSSTNRR